MRRTEMASVHRWIYRGAAVVLVIVVIVAVIVTVFAYA
jgi:hypothetical protein